MSWETPSQKVFVVAAFHQPSMALARRQIESLLAQTGVALSVVAVLDGAATSADAELAGLLRRSGFDVITNPVTRGVAKAFAAGLDHAIRLSGDGEAWFSFCDQDDVWHPEKLARSLDHLLKNNAELVHCDARVVSETGELIAHSLHRYKSRQDPTNLLEALLLNSVTGMTAVFTARTARLTFGLLTDFEASLLHDHVAAVAAASLGRISLLDEPLVDYVQHARNSIGAKPAVSRPWYERVMAIEAVRIYRETSRCLYKDRQLLAGALSKHGVLSADVRALFLPENRLQIAGAVCSALPGMCGRGQLRRAKLLLRMIDGADQFIRSRSVKTN